MTKPAQKSQGGSGASNEPQVHPLVVDLNAALDRVAEEQGPASFAALDKVVAKINKELINGPELWGAGAVGDHLGQAHQNLYKKVERGTIPAPMYDLPSGRLWRADDIRTFARKKVR